jgi:hypothetical protein
MDNRDDVFAGERMAGILPSMREFAGAKFKDPTGDGRRYYEYPQFVDMNTHMAAMVAASAEPVTASMGAGQLQRAQTIGETLLAMANE